MYVFLALRVMGSLPRILIVNWSVLGHSKIIFPNNNVREGTLVSNLANDLRTWKLIDLQCLHVYVRISINVNLQQSQV